jgi:serine/threonine protein phosphatase PrpC
MNFAWDSHPGLKRDNNEDRFHCDPARGIFLVVDGMGGQAAGEQAAEIAVVKLRARLERPTGTSAERIREAIALANNEIHRQGQENPAWKGMACVLSIALVENDRVTIGHVGDTRIYKLRAGQIRKITHDHSPIGIREERGDLSELEAMRHPRRNEVFRDLGSEPRTPQDEDFIEIIEAGFEPESALLLCSDGLSDLVTSAQIQQVAEEHAGKPDAVVAQLIQAANEAGGRDNITVVFVENTCFAERVGRNRTSVLRAKTARGRLGVFLLGALVGGLVFCACQVLIGGQLFGKAFTTAPAMITVHALSEPSPAESATPLPPASPTPEPK